MQSFVLKPTVHFALKMARTSSCSRKVQVWSKRVICALALCHQLYFIAAVLSELTTKEFFINSLGSHVLRLKKKKEREYNLKVRRTHC